MKWIISLILTILLAPIISIIIWYSAFFLPYIYEIRKIAELGFQHSSPSTALIYKYALVAESRQGIRGYAVSKIHRGLLFHNKPPRSLIRNISGTLWYIASYIHFNDRDIFGVWLFCALSECDQGFQEASIRYYKKDLSSLSERELVGLVAMVRGQNYYKLGSSRLEERIDAILGKAKTYDVSF